MGISSKDLIDLLNHIPKPLERVAIEVPQWYKDYMENKYGKLEKKNEPKE